MMTFKYKPGELVYVEDKSRSYCFIVVGVLQNIHKKGTNLVLVHEL